MLGIRFVKTDPTTYLLQYRGGQAVREGVGLSFFYYAPTTSGTVPLDTLVRVRLDTLEGAQTAVVSQTGGLRVAGVDGGPWKSVLARPVGGSAYAVWARADAEVCPGTGDPVASGWTLLTASVAGPVDISTDADTSAATRCESSATYARCVPSIGIGNCRSGNGRVVRWCLPGQRCLSTYLSASCLSRPTIPL